MNLRDTAEYRTGNIIAFLFVFVILIYAASGPMTEFVRWFIETTTPGFEDMSRKEQRLLFREH